VLLIPLGEDAILTDVLDTPSSAGRFPPLHESHVAIPEGFHTAFARFFRGSFGAGRRYSP